MLFCYEDVQNRIHEMFGSWLSKAEPLEPVNDLYFDARYNQDIGILHQFLSLIQAIETYHRRFKDNYILPPEEHARRLEEILNSVSEEDRGFLERRLKHSNEPSLQERLLDILEFCSDIADYFVAPKKRGKFSERVTISRNYYTHYAPELKEKVASWEELSCINYKLSILLTICLLNELGLSILEIKDSMWRSVDYVDLLKHVKSDCANMVTFTRPT